MLIKPNAGGAVALSGGAEVNIPADAVTDSTLLGLHVTDKPPEAPIPRSMIGRAFDFSLDGADLTGLARHVCPCRTTSRPTSMTWRPIAGTAAPGSG